MRKPIGLFVAAFATVAGGGLAVAIEDDGTAEQPVDVTQNLFAEEDPSTTSSSSTSSSTSSTDTTGTTDTTATTAAPADETDDVEAQDNHGAVVSQAARVDCWAEGVENHGQCVSEVAHDHDHDGTPDHGPGSPDHPAGETDDADDAGAATSGNGHGRGNGNGRQGDEG